MVKSLHGILIYVGFIMLEAHAKKDVELPRMFGGRPSDLWKFLLWDYICWPHNMLHKLTHLSLHKQLTTPTFNEFLDMLKDSELESPCLEVLHLEQARLEIPYWTSIFLVILPKQQVGLPSTYPAYVKCASFVGKSLALLAYWYACLAWMLCMHIFFRFLMMMGTHLPQSSL